MYNATQEAANLTEKVYSAKGSGQANEVQRLIREALIAAYEAGKDDLNSMIHGEGYAKAI